MHILFLNFKKFWGGGEKMACALARGARDNGHQVSFMVRPRAPLQDRLAATGIPAIAVNYRNPLKLAAAFRQHGPYDLLVTQSDQEIQYAYYLALFSGTPIMTRLGVSARPSAGWFSRLLHHHTVRVNLANFAAGLDMLKDVYGSALRCPVLLPNGVQAPPAVSKEPRRALGIPSDALVIGMVGRLEERKGCRLLLAAFQSLALRYPNLHLFMVGEGGLRAEMEHHTGERFHVCGFVEAVGDVFRCIDMLALPVLSGEGTSNAVLEAMSLGLPVIVTDDGGMQDVVCHGETGLLIPKGDQTALERALAQLVENEALRCRLGTAARKWVEDHHDMNGMVETFLHWVRQATARKKVRSK
jgi:glycosyltransferase involved in cell wall biosynthesis